MFLTPCEVAEVIVFLYLYFVFSINISDTWWGCRGHCIISYFYFHLQFLISIDFSDTWWGCTGDRGWEPSQCLLSPCISPSWVFVWIWNVLFLGRVDICVCIKCPPPGQGGLNPSWLGRVGSPYLGWPPDIILRLDKNMLVTFCLGNIEYTTQLKK